MAKGFFKQSAGIHRELSSFSNQFENQVSNVVSEVISVGARAYREAAERGFDKAMLEVVRNLDDVLRKKTHNGAGNLTLEYRQDKEVTAHDGKYERQATIPTSTDLKKTKARLRKEYYEKHGFTARNNTVKNASASFLAKYTDPRRSDRVSEANSRAIAAARRDARNRLETRILKLEDADRLSKEQADLKNLPKFTAPNNFFRGYRYYVKDRGYSTKKKPSAGNLEGDSLITWLKKRTKVTPELNARMLRQVLGGLEENIYGNPFKYALKQKASTGRDLKNPYFVKENRSGKFTRVKIADAILPNIRIKDGFSVNENGSVSTPTGRRISAVSAAKSGIIGTNVTFTVMNRFYQVLKTNKRNAFMFVHHHSGWTQKSPRYKGIFGGHFGGKQGQKIERLASDPDGTHGSIDPFTEEFAKLLDPRKSIIFKSITDELGKLASTANSARANKLGVALKIKV